MKKSSRKKLFFAREPGGWNPVKTFSEGALELPGGKPVKVSKAWNNLSGPKGQSGWNRGLNSSLSRGWVYFFPQN
jgi:hypothetical protein